MTTVTISEVARLIAATLEGRISRRELAARASACDAGYGRSNPFGNTTEGRAALSALWALLAADISEDLDMDRPGKPHFIRDDDLREWAAILHKEDWSGNHPLGIRTKRLHQIATAPFAAALLNVSPSTVCERLGVTSLRGLDDLDYFQMVLFDDARGRQVFLDWHMRAPMPDATLYLESEVDADDTLADLLSLLDLDRSAVTWRPESPGHETRTRFAP
ncbi:MAG TPA: hypothetical protein VF625_02240 [Longimicrobium sp.]